jgi:[NiFe] hydrogenase diaphorase moiety large subunit
MGNDLENVVKDICARHGNDGARLMDIARDVQESQGCVSAQAMDLISQFTRVPRVEVQSLVSFYAFLSEQPQGPVIVRVCDDIIDRIQGCDEVLEAIKDELGIDVGQTTADGRISLVLTPCMGMCDQSPSVLVNEVVLTDLDAGKARKVAQKLKDGTAPQDLVERYGDGNNAHELVRAMVKNNIRKTDQVIFAEMEPGAGLRKALALTPAEVIRDIKTSRLRGRGGAGFPSGMKWDFTRQAEGERKFVICNADEGEPGTFKDRALLTEKPGALFEGMAIAGYAVGASEGILYLRGEYAYLRRFLESVLAEYREKGLLGENILGEGVFKFDIKIQMGAGAYICGEETSLISSCEGLRGDPKTRPPFPAQKGYLGYPTTVNNVETFICAARILEMGPGWFADIGSEGSAGTKLLSVSGDCKSPGIYEVPFGMTLGEFLKLCGGEDARAVQMGGPSGKMVGKEGFEREICYDDLATGGSVMVFNASRNLLDVVHYFMEFFIEESCGYCTPCRVGNVLLKERLEQIINGRGEPADLEYLQSLGDSVKKSSRCGLGQTSPNPILSTIESFRSDYEKLVEEDPHGFQRSFDIAAAVGQAEEIAGHKSVLYST